MATCWRGRHEHVELVQLRNPNKIDTLDNIARNWPNPIILPNLIHAKSWPKNHKKWEIEFLSPFCPSGKYNHKKPLTPLSLWHSAFNRLREYSHNIGFQMKYRWPQPCSQLNLEIKNIRHVENSRFSKRQKHTISLHGYMGTGKLTGNIDTILPILAAGEILQIGRATTAGLGSYRLRPIQLS